MSYFYMTVKTMTRGKQSAVASASYRSGQSLYSEMEMETKSYRKREVQPDSFILAPDHAPNFVFDREKLWNEVESVETIKNARLAREVLVALPVELSNDDQKKMLKEYVQENFVNDGMVADVSIHRDRNENPHAHIMLTVRPFNLDGTWGNKKKSELIIDEKGEPVLNEQGKKKYKTIQLTNWDRRESVVLWRKNYAEKINEYFKKNEVSKTVSHESYEKQGLDKLPKQRLTRAEYQFEKKQKEQAEQQGKEYKPTTHYAQENAEIDKANKELEVINKKIVSLADYRNKQNVEQIDKLNQIRKTIKLSDSDWKDLKVVANRVNGFLDINNAKDNLVKLDNWKRKIEAQERLLNAEENILKKARKAFGEKETSVMLYGFIPSKFKDQFNEKLEVYRKNKEKMAKTIESFDQLYKTSERAYAIQKEFTNEEFRFLYPHYDELIKDDNHKVMELKNKYVDAFRNEGVTRAVIQEFEAGLSLLSDQSAKDDLLIKDWKEVKNSLVILERTKEKRKTEYHNNYKEFDAEKVYKSSLSYAEVTQQIKDKEDKKENLKVDIFDSVKDKYPLVTEELIKQIPTEIQSKLIELHLNDKQTGSLSIDLKQAQREIEKNQKSKQFEDHNKGDDSNSKASDVGSLFSQLIGSAQKQENQYDHKSEMKKKKKQKLYNDHSYEQEM